MGIRDQRTKLVNKTGQRISFDVDRGICPLCELPAGKSRSASLNLIRKLCRDRNPPNWSIRILINDRFYGMHLHPRHHILKMTRIIFRYKWRADGSCVPIAEGVVENFYDRIFGCCVKLWEKKIYIEISEADSTWSIRGFEDPNTARRPVRNEQNLEEVGDPASPWTGSEIKDILKLRQASWRFILALPTHRMRLRRLWSGGGGGGGIASGTAAATWSRRRRLYRLLSLRRRNMFNRFHLFVLAFILVGSVHLVLNYV